VEPHADQLLDQRHRKLIDAEAGVPLTWCVAFGLLLHLGKDRVAVRQVAQVVLKLRRQFRARQRISPRFPEVKQR
jgi:hypothetical protein